MPVKGIYDNSSARKSRNLSEPIKIVCQQLDCYFCDAGLVAKAGVDGCHMDEESHKKLAKEFKKMILNIKDL